MYFSFIYLLPAKEWLLFPLAVLFQVKTCVIDVFDAALMLKMIVPKFIPSIMHNYLID